MILFFSAELVKGQNGEFLPELPDALDTWDGWVIGFAKSLGFNEVVYTMEMLPLLHAVYIPGYRFDYGDNANLRWSNLVGSTPLIERAIADTMPNVDRSSCLYLGGEEDRSGAIAAGVPFELFGQWVEVRMS